MKNKLVIIATLVISPFLAQNYTSIEDVDLLNKHRLALIRQSPNLVDKLNIERVEQINEHHSKIVYYDGGVYHEALVNDNLSELLLIATFREIQKSTLPKIVFDAWKQSESGDGSMKKMYKVTTPYESSFYALDAEKNGTVERSYFTDLGRYKEPLY
jgi:hypothetical protein